MARKSFKAGALTAPLPPVMVTVGTGDKTNVLTIAWTGILSTHPPRTYISVRPERHSYKLLRESGEFVINLAPASLARTVDYVGVFTGAKVDKLKECGLATVPSEKVEVPTLADCPFALECRVCEVIPMGTHDVFIADILSVSADESILDESGRICFDKADLLAYAHGEYFALGEKLGRFGFSAKKPEKKTKSQRRTAPTTQSAETESEQSSDSRSARTASTAGVVTPTANSRRKKSGNAHPTGEEVGSADGKTGGTRPFYLTAPKGRGGKKQGKKRGKRR